MAGSKLRVAFAVLFTLHVLGTQAFAEGGDPAAKRMRKQIRALKEQVAALKAEMLAQTSQIRSEVEYLARDRGPGSGFAPGGFCGGDPCKEDSDGDGLGDCEDVCPCEPSTASGQHADKDGDQNPDCLDPCPDDATDACIDPCRNDSDGDGTNDCEDSCPWDPSPAADRDGDGLFDCTDPCPDDASNACGIVCVLDQDGDGSPDCKDPCPWVADSGEVGPAGCPFPRPIPLQPHGG